MAADPSISAVRFGLGPALGGAVECVSRPASGEPIGVWCNSQHGSFLFSCSCSSPGTPAVRRFSRRGSDEPVRDVSTTNFPPRRGEFFVSGPGVPPSMRRVREWFILPATVPGVLAVQQATAPTRPKALAHGRSQPSWHGLARLSVPTAPNALRFGMVRVSFL